jgi:hypothetical protein
MRGADRWVRQGQKLITLTSNGTSIDLLSPVEGVVTAINDDALRRSEPGYERSLRERLDRDREISRPQSQSEESDPGFDGRALDAEQREPAECDLIGPRRHWPRMADIPISGLLPRLRPELRQKVVKEFFLS